MQQIIEFSGNHPYLVGLAVVLTMVLIANELRLFSRKDIDVSPSQTVALMNNGAKVIDIRSVDRFHAGHIMGAAHIALDELEAKAEKTLKKYKDKFIIVYDENGMQGARASTLLRGLEYKAVNLKGGIAAWTSDSLPLEKGK
ncbi:MAG: rhodanese-like domain-containing protein [Gammaproteobacteria bacterium]